MERQIPVSFLLCTPGFRYYDQAGPRWLGWDFPWKTLKITHQIWSERITEVKELPAPPAARVELQTPGALHCLSWQAVSTTKHKQGFLVKKKSLWEIQMKKGDIMKNRNTKRALNMAWVKFLISLCFHWCLQYFYKIFSVFFMMSKWAVNSIIFTQVMNKVTNQVKIW